MNSILDDMRFLFFFETQKSHMCFDFEDLYLIKGKLIAMF